MEIIRSNNTNKLSPQELLLVLLVLRDCSNNTNKLSPQEPLRDQNILFERSNNTNKLSPQEHVGLILVFCCVQIIQINLALKNHTRNSIQCEMFK